MIRKGIILFLCLFLFYACSSGNTFHNKKYGYSLRYPRSWFVGSLGEAKRANVVWFVSNKKDVRQSDGGQPLGAKVEIIVQDLGELKKMDPRFPEIKNAKDWLDWERSGYSKFDKDSRMDQANYKDEKVKVAGRAAIKTVNKGGSAEDPYPSIRVTLFDSPRVYQIQYLGREPTYSRDVSVFYRIVDSFRIK